MSFASGLSWPFSHLFLLLLPYPLVSCIDTMDHPSCPFSLYGPPPTLWPCPVPPGPSYLVLSQPASYLPFLGPGECWSIYFIFFFLFSVCFYAFFGVFCLSSFPHPSYFLFWEWFWFLFSTGVPVSLVGYTLQLSLPLCMTNLILRAVFFSQD